jgi:hypothetical protein
VQRLVLTQAATYEKATSRLAGGETGEFTRKKKKKSGHFPKTISATSKDEKHARLVPYLLRDYQSFIPYEELKTNLSRFSVPVRAARGYRFNSAVSDWAVPAGDEYLGPVFQRSYATAQVYSFHLRRDAEAQRQ